MANSTILLLHIRDELRPLIAEKLPGHTLIWGLRADRPIIDQVADLQPGLIIIGAADVPLWVADLRSNPATRRIPALAIAADSAEPGDLERARAYGVTDGIPEAQFIGGLPGTVEGRLRSAPDSAALAAGCAGLLPERAREGIAQFNAGQFFEAHETLEHAWNEAEPPVKEVYRAILQVAVAYYQIERGNYRGAHKMFLRLTQWLAPLPGRCQGIDLDALRADAAAARAHLESLGPERIAAFERSLLRPINIAGSTFREL